MKPSDRTLGIHRLIFRRNFLDDNSCGSVGADANTGETCDLVVVGGGLAGRAEILSTSFETLERNITEQLGRMLSPGGFDPPGTLRR